jgi:aryl-alcohol dehydrogenase-like predicted oxidoreductase
MQYRQIGDSDLTVSEIALGSWVTFAGGVGFDTTRACTEAAFDAGITFFDTANMYGHGEAERAWGQILSAHPRDSYVLATKVWGPMSDTDSGLSAAQIAKQIDASLERLQTDHVDLYYAHRFDTRVPIEETIEAFQRVVDQGKARYIGFSEWLPEQIEAAIEIAGPDLFVASQPQYSMLWRAPEVEVFPLSERIRVSQVVWSPLAQGILTGKYLPGEPFPAGSRAADPEQARFFDIVLRPGVLEAVHGAARPGMGAPQIGGGCGDHGSLPSGAGPRERRRSRNRPRPDDARRGRRGARRGPDHRAGPRDVRRVGGPAPLIGRALLTALTTSRS